MAGESDERTSPVVCGTGESHGLGVFGLDAGDSVPVRDLILATPGLTQDGA